MQNGKKQACQQDRRIENRSIHFPSEAQTGSLPMLCRRQSRAGIRTIRFSQLAAP